MVDISDREVETIGYCSRFQSTSFDPLDDGEHRNPSSRNIGLVEEFLGDGGRLLGHLP
jgi:hypothetical protein